MIRATVDEHIEPLRAACEQLLSTLDPLVLGTEDEN